MISNFLNESTIQLQLEAKNMEESIALAAKPLVENGRILEGYIDQMVNAVKELGPYIVIVPGFALAHGRPSENVIKQSMSMATFKTPVIFGHESNDPVTTVMVIASPDDGGHVDALASVSKLLLNEAFMTTLKNTNDVREIMRYFEEDGNE
ncbi:Ascorbate-specific PTS system EIIA component [Eubacterium callanderi]|uniref:PTS sugar transporter subunit IIA n=1 Tax=Eubacterium callanderi TaxID=53442 RepID=UPI0029FEDB8A|nr:PTS sugar transporter subunit IIA [Eubacterium callanderi]WPK69243.1 Ascorbate-specific PTS system EIIA component [Eubacterium callanderi]WPK73541.1 Ascorbate-specific PTS system EIIA component [Eubacterium callanderi]